MTRMPATKTNFSSLLLKNLYVPSIKKIIVVRLFSSSYNNEKCMKNIMMRVVSAATVRTGVRTETFQRLGMNVGLPTQENHILTEKCKFEDTIPRFYIRILLP